MIKHLIIEALQNVAQYALIYVAGAAIPYSISVLKKAKLKTKSKTMAEIFSIATDVIIDLQPVVDDAKKDGVFSKEEALRIKNHAIQEIKETLRAEHKKLLRKLISDMSNEHMIDKILGRIIERVLIERKESILPNKFMGIHFDWKF